MNKFKRSTVLPAILFVYLCVMACLGYKGVRSGETSLTTYILTIAVTLALIVVLHFFLKKREQIRQRKLADNDKQQNSDNI